MLFAALEILFRQRWRYLALFVVLPLVAAAVCVQMYPKATVAESLWIGNQTYLVTGRPYYQQYLTPAALTLTDMTEYFQTGEFFNGVAKRLEKQHAVQSQSELDAAMGSLGTLVARADGPNLLSLTDTCPRTALCIATLNAALQVFEQHEGAVLTQQETVAAQVYTMQLQNANAALSQAQQAVSAYLATHPQETAAQQAVDSHLQSLNQTVTTAKAAADNAQTKLNNVASSALSSRLANQSLYQVIDHPHPISGRMSSLPKKQMLMAAAAFWALGLLMLVLTLRLKRVVLHPAQLERVVGFPPVAVMAPLHAGGTASTGRLLGEGGSQ